MKIFIIGSGPLPNEKKGIRNAGGLRTAQFLEAIKNTKHKTFLCTIEEVLKSKKIKSDHLAINKKNTNIDNEIIKEINKFNPDILLSINTFPSFIAAKIIKKLKNTSKKDIYFWADLNGWAIAEGQAQATKLESDAFMGNFYQMEKTVLLNADKISVVSTPQKFATIGELGFLGRLNRETFKYEFVEVVPNATTSLKIDKQEKNEQKVIKNKMEKTAFLVTQVGGFNSWLDEKTLFKGLEDAMEKNQNIHFACTGGAIKNIDEKTFPSFKKRVEKSKYKDRFHLLGWVETGLIKNVYNESDCIINVDFDCTETQTGARNRLNEAMKFGLPIITTLGSEIANDIVRENAALGANNGDFKEISKLILELAKDKKLKEKLVNNGKNLLRNKFSVKITTKSFIDWLNDPKYAPKKIINIEKISIIKAGMLFLKKRGAKEFVKKICQKIR